MNKDRISDLQYRRLLCYADSALVAIWFESTLITDKLPWFMESIPLDKRQYIVCGIMMFVAATAAGGYVTSKEIKKLKELDS